MREGMVVGEVDRASRKTGSLAFLMGKGGRALCGGWR
jgi:hypothetical protein